ncbi:hypothetical protein [Paenarthrobacter sp. NCHU4564]|uniref:hypothetical protein n=1 Tax=Paenarthrobacter sp. NCHU4564 TaxID=3451353 RepID=UPI003F9751E9
MRGRNWLVRGAEQRLGPELGELRFIASSRHIYWKALLPCLAVGFVFGVIGEFITPIRSTRNPAHFSDPVLFVVASILTGLLLWSMSLLGSFRKLLVFQGGLVARYAQPRTTIVIPWKDIAPESIKAVTTPDGTDPERRLVASRKVSLGAAGRQALVFKALGSYWIFSTDDEPAGLLSAVQQSMVDAGVPGAGQVMAGALPAVAVGTRTALD